MNSIPLAMTWEFWNRHRWNLLLTLFAMASLLTIVFATIASAGVRELPRQGLISLHIALTLMQAFCVGGMMLHPQGNLSRLYAWPVTTVTIVQWKLLPAMAAAFVLCVLNTLYVNTVFDAGWPLLAPALYLMCIVPAVQAAAWLGEKAPLVQIVGLTSVAVPVWFWLKSRYGALFEQPMYLWSEITSNDLICLAAFAVTGYVGCLVGIARDRCGESLRWVGLAQWIEERWHWPAPKSTAFQSRATAHFWYEWRQKGWLMPIASLLGIASVFAVTRFKPGASPQYMLDGLRFGSFLLPVFGFVVGLALGTSGWGRDKSLMSGFPASRPISDTAFAYTMLAVMFLSVLLSWLGWGAALTIVDLFNREAIHDPFHRGIEPQHLFYLALPLTWITTSLTLCVIQTGHPTLFVKLFVGLFLSVISWGFFAGFVARLPEAFVVGLAPMLAITAAFVGTCWAFVNALRRRHISVPVFCILPLALLLAGVASVSLSDSRAPRYATSLVAFSSISVGALFVLPLAAGPLAISWNRHR